MAAGAQRGWTLAGVDVKTVFLQVPPGRSKDIVVVNPPTIFQECQITEPGELWAVEGSVYRPYYVTQGLGKPPGRNHGRDQLGDGR